MITFPTRISSSHLMSSEGKSLQDQLKNEIVASAKVDGLSCIVSCSLDIKKPKNINYHDRFMNTLERKGRASKAVLRTMISDIKIWTFLVFIVDLKASSVTFLGLKQK